MTLIDSISQCFCDKKKGECYWQGQGKLNIQAQISKMRCETNEEEKVDDNDLEDIIKRPLQITPGLTCGKSNDRIVGGNFFYSNFLQQGSSKTLPVVTFFYFKQ